MQHDHETKKYARGVVIGKLYPVHAGHVALIRRAVSQCAVLDLILCERRGEHPSGAVRESWLRELLAADLAAGRVRLLRVEDTYDQDDSKLWASLTLNWIAPGPPHLAAVFTSEAYGDPYAKWLTELSGHQVVHECVDRPRTVVPVSGTLVRTKPMHPRIWPRWQWAAGHPAIVTAAGDVPDLLPLPTRAWYILRVVLCGAESCGKSTLAQRLAAHYATAWIGEVGRDVTVDKLRAAGSEPVALAAEETALTADWHSSDFVRIARMQTAAEDTAAREAAAQGVPLVVCDTDALATLIWHERYMVLDPAATPAAPEPTGEPVPAPAPIQPYVAALEAHVRDLPAHRHRALYLVPDPTKVPFVQDGTRDGEHLRDWMHARFVAELAARGEACAVLDADGYDGRFEQAVAAIDAEVARLRGGEGAE
ncbi:hypothetical protein H9P43_002110 [Blastocladiella emersonii ATCC 22665]|nr:hypothetical protein H9P43_002110 [Blastocladiella emersonii ATCC 22665]